MLTDSKLLKAGLVSVLYLGISACATKELAVSRPSDEPLRAEVEMIRLNHTILLEEDGTTTPSIATLDAIHRFLMDTEIRYGDTVVLDTGSQVLPERVKAIENFIRAHGANFGGVKTIGAAPAEGNIQLYVERYIVTPPQCGEWTPESTPGRKNNASPHWSCSSVRNRALMVANPRDLVDGQRGSTSGNAVRAIRKYNSQEAGSGGKTSSQSSGDSSAVGDLFRAFGNVADSSDSSSSSDK